ISSKTSNLARKMNRFNPTLFILGILPHHLKVIAKDHNMNYIDESLNLLSDTMFWEGYEIWKKRKKLVKIFGKILLQRNGSWGKKGKKISSKAKVASELQKSISFLRKNSGPNCATTYDLCSDIKGINNSKDKCMDI